MKHLFTEKVVPIESDNPAIKIDYDKCGGCGECEAVCPKNVIKRIPGKNKIVVKCKSCDKGTVVKEKCAAGCIGCKICEKNCPVGAIKMVNIDPQDKKSLRIPVVNEERCIGCGACENLCPSRPFSAIYVEGHEVHKTI